MPEPLADRSESLRAKAIRQRRQQERSAVAMLLVLAVALFVGGITWGLPTREDDRFLFGLRAAWSGRRILQLAGSRATGAAEAADIDRDPLAGREGKVQVNRTDAQRAQILRRYRLFTSQPDEMVTMMALAEMHPGRGIWTRNSTSTGGCGSIPWAHCCEWRQR